MGASREVILEPKDWDLSGDYGHYLRQEEVEKIAPELMDEWILWLDGQCDPGNYYSSKVIRDGEVVWVSETFMPAKLCIKLEKLIKAKN